MIGCPLLLETDRLTLRELGTDDLDAMATLLEFGYGRCAVILRATGELVGDCGLAPTEVEGRPETELGWIVRRSHWGRGIAPEAGAAWRDFAFGELGLDRIVSMVSEANLASRRVAEKLGMEIERTAIWGGIPMLMYAQASPGVR